jgi:hypothetical protein
MARMRRTAKTMALRHFGRGGFLGGGSLSGSQADLGDYPALLARLKLQARLKEMTGWDDSARWPAGALPEVGPFDLRVIAVGGIAFAVLMALSDRYGFDRDELYFLDCARHLQASYVDQPVLAPLLAWVSLKLFGVSLPGLRVWPALAAWATVVVAGLTAREFGGTRRAQLLAAFGTAMATWLLSSDHLANTTPYALLAWAALALVVVRIGRTGDCRWWLAGGVVAGLGVADDHSEAFLAIAVVIGALLSGGRKMIWNGWFAAGAVIMLAFEVPDLWWQAQHGWATIPMTEALNRENGGLAQVGPWIFGQLGNTIVTLAGVPVIGLWCLWRSGRPLWRALAWAYGLLFVLFAFTAGAKGYYLAAAYVYLLAAGAVAIDRWLQARPGRLRNLMLVTAVLTAVNLPGALPVLPAAGLARTFYKSNETQLETIGWPRSSEPSMRYGRPCRPASGPAPCYMPTTTAWPGPLTSSAGGRDYRSPSAGRTASGGGGPVTRAPPPSWPWRQGPSVEALATPPTSGSFSPASGWRPRCRIRTASTTCNGAATSTSAPALSSRVARYGNSYANTADS